MHAMKTLLTAVIMNVARKHELYGRNQDPPYGRRVRTVRREGRIRKYWCHPQIGRILRGQMSYIDRLCI